MNDRKKWKTLRDFVDERAIEDVLESIENDRNQLDVSLAFLHCYASNTEQTHQSILSQTDAYPENLTNTISSIKSSLPVATAATSISIEHILESQADVSTHMASHLESLASHYDQMAGALKETESEKGEIFSEEDLQGAYI